MLTLLAVLAPVASARAEVASDIRAVSDEVLRSWRSQQTASGIFPNPQPAEIARGHGGFAPPMIMYAMQRAGERLDDSDLIAGAESAWPIKVSIAHASAFDVIGAAYAFRQLGLSPLARAGLADYLRWYAVPPNGRGCIIRPRCYHNLVLVDALAVLASTGTGLRSITPGTRLADPKASRAYAATIINQRVPRIVDRRLRARVAGAPVNAGVLSDPPNNPLAYHALSTFVLAEAVKELGPVASPRARATLLQALDALSVLVGPDGDVSYMGRGQGQVWVPAVTVGAMVDGAALTAATDPLRASRYLAVADRALGRLRSQHVGPVGFRVVPGDRATYAGLDRYVHTVAYNGLALFALTVAADTAATLPPIAPGVMPADQSMRVLDARASGLGIVSTGRLWMAVHYRATSLNDLRYGSGLIGLQLRQADGTWRNVLAPRPRTESLKGVPSTGPTLLRRGSAARFRGRRLTAWRRTLKVVGYLPPSRSKQHRTTISYRPAGDAVVVRVAGLKRGRRYGFVVFAPAGTGDLVARRLRANGATWRFSRPISVRRITNRFHSGPVENLDALVVSLRAPRNRRVTFTIADPESPALQPLERRKPKPKRK